MRGERMQQGLALDHGLRPPPAVAMGELRSGSLGVRVATTEAELDAVQALRYRIFYDEMGARPDAAAAQSRRDRDEFDVVADHLMVVDHAVGPGPEGIVATYRMIRQPAAALLGGFYSADEYDISAVTGFPGHVLELGRSCVDAAYRGRSAMQLLWRGLAAYVFLNRIDLMFGCASLPGTDPDALSTELSYLYYNHLAPLVLRPRALPERYVDMRRVDPETLDGRRAVVSLPPLIKGYLRLGGFFFFFDLLYNEFYTTDIAIVVKTNQVTDKYYRHYEREQRDALD